MVPTSFLATKVKAAVGMPVAKHEWGTPQLLPVMALFPSWTLSLMAGV